MELERSRSYEERKKAARMDIIEEELYGHPGIKTPEQKVSFIRKAFQVNEKELVIDTTNEARLNETFAFASFLERRIVQGKLPEIAKNKAEKLGGKNLIEAMQQEDISMVFDHYIEVFDMDYRG